MQAVIAMAALFTRLGADGAELVRATDKAIAEGTPYGDGVAAICLYPDRFLPLVRDMDKSAQFDVHQWVEIRAACKDPGLKPWCYAKLASGTSDERSAAARGLYRTGAKEDIPILLRSLGHEDTDMFTALALGRLRAKEAIPHLLARLGQIAPQQFGECGTVSGDRADMARVALEWFGPEIVPSVLPFMDVKNSAKTVTEVCILLRGLAYYGASDQVFTVAENRVRTADPKAKDWFEKERELQELCLLLMEAGDPRAETILPLLSEDQFRRGPVTPDPTPTLPQLIQQFENGQAVKRDHFAFHLSHNPAVVISAFETNLSKLPPVIACELITVLIYQGAWGVSPANVFEAAVQSSDAMVRVHGLYGLQEHCRPEAKGLLIQLMFDSDANVRNAAHEAAVLQIGIPLALGKN